MNSITTYDRLDNENPANTAFVVTRSAVAATMDIGVGHAGLVKLCRYLDMAPTHHSTYSTHVKAITQANVDVTKQMTCDAAKVVRQVYKELNPSIDEHGPIDITVSFDGSWMTRGHRSNYGIGCVVEVVTGLVLDLAILSLYCQGCTQASARFGGRHNPEFRKWHETHTECNQNYSGSIEKHNFRYTTLLSDGDAKTFKHLCSLNVYGDVPPTKEECVNHVAKRMGTAFRNLSTQGKKKGVTLGGRGYGKLTQAAITKYTGYFGKAIRAHPNDLEAMKNDVFATFHHAISTDEKPDHDLCPKGNESWCFYQKALAAGEVPGSHRTHVGTPLSEEVGAVVKDVYVRLGHTDLLGRCLMGKTQNSNESLHSVVLRKCPKMGFVGLSRVVFASSTAVSEFNTGMKATLQLAYNAMGITTSPRMAASAAKVDMRRLQQSRRQVKASTKEARRARKVAQAKKADASAYAPGAF